jgi:tetratricopeptide (TPR) repeat protein
MTATPVQVRQWSEEVARDPGSLSFLPLAEAYRAQGRRDAALRLCIRGLERNPDNVEAHALLGLLYREGGEQLKAFDEWDIALRLSPDHRVSRREIGLLCLERGDWPAAARHLERALADAPDDADLRSGLELARTNAAVAAPMARPGPAPVAAPQPEPAAAPVSDAVASPAPEPVAAPPSTPVPPPSPPTPAAAQAAPAAPVAGAGSEAAGWDSLQAEFAAIGAERGIVGAVVLDEHGYVLAGEMIVGGRDRAPEVAAVLSGASSEAERAVRHLGLGTWLGILLETPEATVRLAPVPEGMLAIAARREVPTGWVLRVAGRARDAAVRWLGGGAP